MRLSRLVVCALTIWVSTLGSGQAMTREAVRCVQAQLNASGFNAGVVDGIVGGKTRRALAAFEAKHGTLSERPLQRGTAQVYCRFLGLHKRALRTHWPETADTVEVIHSKSVSANIVSEPKGFYATLAQRIRGRHLVLSAKYDLNLVGPVRVALADSIDEAAQMLRAHSSFNVRSARAVVRRYCETPALGGLALPDLVVICRDGSALPDYNTHEDWSARVITHELFHAYQYHLTGAIRVTSRKAHQRIQGPEWFIEGSAEFVSIREIYDPPIWHMKTVVRKRIGSQLPDLTKLARRPKGNDSIEHLYSTGLLAVMDAVNSDDVKILFSFYEALGRSKNWNAVFEDHFGPSITDFERAFTERYSIK